MLRNYIVIDNVVHLDSASVISSSSYCFILLVHIDVEFEARLSIEVNSSRNLLRHLSVFDINELQQVARAS